MKRGVINLTSLELKVLDVLVVAQKDVNGKEKLLTKLSPVEGQIESAQKYDVLISEDEAELILDSMSAPSDDDSPNLISARLKIQRFLLR